MFIDPLEGSGNICKPPTETFTTRETAKISHHKFNLILRLNNEKFTEMS